MRNVFTLPADLAQLGWVPIYPGMVAEETRPLRAFIQKYAASFDEIRFNVRVGPGETAPPDVDPALQRAVEQGTRMRMDCVAWKAPNIATLIEVKVDAGNDAIWQLLTYRDHYVTEHPNESIRLVIVAESATASARVLAQQNGITLALFVFATGTPDITAPATEVSGDGIQ